MQARVLKNCLLGLAYEYSINQYRLSAPNTFGFIMGITPMFSFDNIPAKNHVARCPDLAF